MKPRSIGLVATSPLEGKTDKQQSGDCPSDVHAARPCVARRAVPTSALSVETAEPAVEAL
ncbi:MAG: hypothetical protein IJ191_05540 [Treponema sp.]|nr:hypothetical protein [Treponema sp.]